MFGLTSFSKLSAGNIYHVWAIKDVEYFQEICAIPGERDDK